MTDRNTDPAPAARDDIAELVLSELREQTKLAAEQNRLLTKLCVALVGTAWPNAGGAPGESLAGASLRAFAARRKRRAG